MAKFNYRMQNILEIKEKLESQAKLEYAAARMVLNEEEERLEALKLRQADYYEEGKSLRNSGLNVRDIIDNKDAIMRLEDFIKEQVLQVRVAERNLESARVKLTELMQDRKTHEKLREKAFESFMKEEQAKESKEIDELTSYVYGQKIGD